MRIRLRAPQRIAHPEAPATSGLESGASSRPAHPAESQLVPLAGPAQAFGRRAGGAIGQQACAVWVPYRTCDGRSPPAPRISPRFVGRRLGGTCELGAASKPLDRMLSFG